MQTIQVSFVDPSKSGKSVRIKAKDGSVYYAKPEQNIQAGTTIEAVIKPSEYEGKTMNWINEWKPVAAPVGASVLASGAVSNGAPYWLPFVSNVVAHAIQSGQITEPGQIISWANTAKNWATGDQPPF